VDDRRRIRNRRLLISAMAVMAMCASGYVFWAMRLWMFVA
jgi:hypothetical protein